ncbi:hypothetical protein EDEG_04181 [Edhazardia aedis USNM 41457]|uniref:Uncharacterized protein n=1 Tax=Edhazardia aedis (strain USNM 41457) TaxID=1003232 RepID=J9DQL5_EDHAE|nr:hypothetical protein EDEG_04181 [Edhazardia aedis USNM 41457]|eukprot:EJW04855.1 hypothetical protein EDEG_04181 [Edhazardia aedis USNM 41457]
MYIYIYIYLIFYHNQFVYWLFHLFDRHGNFHREMWYLIEGIECMVSYLNRIFSCVSLGFFLLIVTLIFSAFNWSPLSLCILRNLVRKETSSAVYARVMQYIHYL